MRTTHECEDRASWRPPWIASIGTAVWISGPDRKISYLNDRAAALLGRPTSRCLGRLCYQVISGNDVSGSPFCSPDCPIHCLAVRRQQIEPVRLQVSGVGGQRHWLQIVSIAVRNPGRSGVSLVHCVLTEDRAHRSEVFLRQVASQSGGLEFQLQKPAARTLTDRETEILELLAQDRTLHEIADWLQLSYTTVRNHVQHILAKLGVHSTMEAVACHLLTRE